MSEHSGDGKQHPGVGNHGNGFIDRDAGVVFLPRKRRPRLTDSERRRISQLYKDGYNMREIAHKVGCNVSSVSRYLKSDKVPLIEGPDGRIIRTTSMAKADALTNPDVDDPPAMATVGDLRRHDPAALEALIGAEGFAVFCRDYLDLDLEDFQIDEVRHMLGNQFAAIFANPAAGKSLIWSVAFPCWVSAGGGKPAAYYAVDSNPLRDQLVLLVSEADKQSGKNLRAIEARLRTRKMVAAYGRFKGEHPWRVADGGLTVSGRRAALTTGDYSISAVGAGTASLSYRADYIILDDFASVKNCRKPETAEALWQWLATNILTRQNANARVMCIMARLPLPNDPSKRIEDLTVEDIGIEGDDSTASLFACLSLPAVSDFESRTMLWSNARNPQFFPSWKQLMGIRAALGQTEFATVYQQDRFEDSGAGIRLAWIESCYDKERGLEQSKTIMQAGEALFSVRVLSVDPSPTNFNGLILADVPVFPGQPRFAPVLLDLMRDRLGTDTLVQTLYDWYLKHRYRVLILEQNIAHFLRSSSDWHRFVSATKIIVIFHKTTGESKNDREYGWQTLGRDFERGDISIPWGDPLAAWKMKLLVDELTGKLPTDDLIDALWFMKYNLLALNSIGKDLLADSSPGYNALPQSDPFDPSAPPPRLMEDSLASIAR